MTVVRSQSDLDAAIQRGDTSINIDSPAGMWITLRGNSHVVARGSSHVVAWDSSHVEARDSSHVVAWDSSHVVAWDSSHVEARDSSHVVARGSSHVVAWGNSHVVARGSSHVEARGNSHVVAWGSHVVAWDSSHVVARGSSHVVAWGSSHVEARGSSHVVAAKYVAVHLHSQRVTLAGGVVIDMTEVDATDTATWLELTGATVAGKRITVYKAVRDNYCSAHGTKYPVGGKASCDDFEATTGCGQGLHFSPSPAQAASYDSRATRFLRCEVKVSEVQCLDADKLKAPRCWVIAEVDRFGRDL